MSKIDIDKFIAYLYDAIDGNDNDGMQILHYHMEKALVDQGLSFNGEDLVEMKKPVNFEDFPREEQLKWYICTKAVPHKDGRGLMPLFCEGEPATLGKIEAYCQDMTPRQFTEHFRKVTEADLPQGQPHILSDAVKGINAVDILLDGINIKEMVRRFKEEEGFVVSDTSSMRQIAIDFYEIGLVDMLQAIRDNNKKG